MFCIGSLRLDNYLIMAPMAGITNLPFRLMMKRMDAGLVTTEMISAMGLTLKKGKTLGYLKSHSGEKPLAVQIFGSSPSVMAAAAQIALESGADILDINMGCPVKKVVKTGAGAALLRDRIKVEKIVSAVRLACPIPLTVKIRTGWSPDQPSALEIAKVIEGCGADAITIHPRFASQGFSGEADWAWIERLKEKINISIIGNGDILEPSDALEMKRQTGCDGVMIGRGAVANPWIFKQILQKRKGLPISEPSLSERKSFIMEHYGLLSDYMDEHRAALAMRGILHRHTKGLPNSSRFRNRVNQVKDLETLTAIMDNIKDELV